MKSYKQLWENAVLIGKSEANEDLDKDIHGPLTAMRIAFYGANCLAIGRVLKITPHMMATWRTGPLDRRTTELVKRKVVCQ